MNRMLLLRYLFRAKLTQLPCTSRFRKLSTSHYHSSENKDPTEGEKKLIDEKSNEPKQTDVNERLKFLIQSMDVSKTPALVADKEFARPRRREFIKQNLKTTAVQPDGIENAAKEVAKSFGGDVKQIEMQLLSKVASQSAIKAKVDGHSSSSSSSSSSDSSSSDSDDEASSPKSKAGAPEPKPKTPADDKPKKLPFNLSELIVGMKIDRSQMPPKEGRASQVRNILGRQSTGEYQPWEDNASNNNEGRSNRKKDNWNDRRNDSGNDRRHDSGNERRNKDRRDMRGGYRNFKDNMSLDLNRAPIEVKLFGKDRLGIFDVTKPQTPEVDQLATWRTLKAREIRLAGTHPPGNYFEEMIVWTDQGKLWKFPIDNEQGLDEERGVSFTEHVFLEHHLEPWCPRKGPVRHFMELVCVGLSKNHHLTASEKRSHVDWFRDYFEQKQDVLLESGALAGEGGGGGGQKAVASA